MGRPIIPVTRANEIRATGISWKEVARKLKAEGLPPDPWPPFDHNSLSRACVVDREYQVQRQQMKVKPPIEIIKTLRAEGNSWKRIPGLLHSMGYPLWHYSTLCNFVSEYSK